MRLFQTFDLSQFLGTVVSLLVAFTLGTLIGAQRQYRQRTAGLRTNVLVAVGSAAFFDLVIRISSTSEAVRVISYVVSVVGFLGAGVRVDQFAGRPTADLVSRRVRCCAKPASFDTAGWTLWQGMDEAQFARSVTKSLTAMMAHS